MKPSYNGHVVGNRKGLGQVLVRSGESGDIPQFSNEIVIAKSSRMNNKFGSRCDSAENNQA